MLNLPAHAFERTASFAKIYCEPTWRWTPREKPLETYDLFYVWSGIGEVSINETSYPVGKGTCMLFRPGDRPGASHDPKHPLTITYIHFHLNEQPDEIPASMRIFRDPVEIEGMLSRYVRTLQRQEYGADEEARLLLKSLMIALLREDRSESVQSDRLTGETEDAVRDAVRYIRERPGVWHTATDLARRARLSPRSFAQRFKEVTGISVQQYIIRTRLERAAHLLRHEGMNVTEAAQALGYKDVYFFSKQFKKIYSINPSQYR